MSGVIADEDPWLDDDVLAARVAAQETGAICECWRTTPLPLTANDSPNEEVQESGCP
jgi:hypothetical protein